MGHENFKEEYKKVGRILQEARLRKGLSVARCAELINTNRRRYANIEEGTAVVGIPELRTLITYLEIEDSELWHARGCKATGPEVVVRVRPGSVVSVVVDEPTLLSAMPEASQ